MSTYAFPKNTRELASTIIDQLAPNKPLNIFCPCHVANDLQSTTQISMFAARIKNHNYKLGGVIWVEKTVGQWRSEGIDLPATFTDPLAILMRPQLNLQPLYG